MWFTEQAAGWYGGLGGGIIGILGGLFGAWGGFCVSRGRARALILGLMWFFTALGLALALTGLLALALRQPWHVWYVFLLPGAILAGVFGGLIPRIRRRYQQVEEARARGLATDTGAATPVPGNDAAAAAPFCAAVADRALWKALALAAISVIAAGVYLYYSLITGMAGAAVVTGVFVGLGVRRGGEAWAAGEALNPFFRKGLACVFCLLAIAGGYGAWSAGGFRLAESLSDAQKAGLRGWMGWMDFGLVLFISPMFAAMLSAPGRVINKTGNESQ